MMPKISVRPIPSSAYVPPRMIAFRTCWRNSSKSSASKARSQQFKGTNLPAAARAPNRLGLESSLDHLAVLDRHKIDGGHVLSAFLAGRAFLVEVDVAVDPLYRDAPERLADRFGVGLAGGFDGRDGNIYAVVAAEALGQAAEVVAALLPFIHISLGDFRVFGHFREPRRKERRVIRAVGCVTRLLDQLVRRIGAATGDDASLELLLLGLFENDRELLDRGRHEQGVGARCLDLG